MSEILLEYPAIIRSSSGEEHAVRVCGREREDERWEAWIEFEPRHGGTTICTPPETTQPDRMALLGWAEALSRVYLEGALQRAVPSSAVDAPAEPPMRSPSTVESEGILDPFEVYAHGQNLLRRHLEGLSVAHLRHIARAHAMVEEGAGHRLAKDELVELIVRETQRRALAEDARPM